MRLQRFKICFKLLFQIDVTDSTEHNQHLLILSAKEFWTTAGRATKQVRPPAPIGPLGQPSQGQDVRLSHPHVGVPSNSRSQSFFASNSFRCQKPASLPRIALYSCELLGNISKMFHFFGCYGIRPAKQNKGPAKPLSEQERQWCNRCSTLTTGFESAKSDALRFAHGVLDILSLHSCSLFISCWGAQNCIELFNPLDFRQHVEFGHTKVLQIYSALRSSMPAIPRISMPSIWPCNVSLGFVSSFSAPQIPSIYGTLSSDFLPHFGTVLLWSVFRSQGFRGLSSVFLGGGHFSPCSNHCFGTFGCTFLWVLGVCSGDFSQNFFGNAVLWRFFLRMDNSTEGTAPANYSDIWELSGNWAC